MSTLQVLILLLSLHMDIMKAGNLVNESLVVNYVVIRHNLDVIPLPHKSREVRRYVVLSLNPSIVG